jgi:hypothetical protein
MITKTLKLIYTTFIYVGLIWLIIHFFAVFGLIITVAYIAGCVFIPKRIPCIFCYIQKDLTYCPVCKKTTDKSEGTTPNSFKSIFFNALLLLGLFVISVGFIFIEHRILTALGVGSTKKTVQFIFEDNAQYKVGQVFPVSINLSNIQTDINAFQADLKYDPNILEVIRIDMQNSFATIIVQKEINNNLGYIRFSGGIPNPGYNNPQAHAGTVYFRGKSPSATEVSVLPTSMVLANDGKGTNVLKSFSHKSYLILPAHPDEIFPEIGHIFEDLPQKDIKTKIDFSTQQSSQSTPSNPSNTFTQMQSTSTLNPLSWLGTLTTFILDLWRIK